MDKILLNQMEFYGYHGVLPEENRLGQRFYVDLILELDLSEAGYSDDVHQTINYAEVYAIVKEIVEGPPQNLIESIGEKIAQDLLANFQRLKCCTIKVIKPDPPIRGHYQSVAIEITRGRSNE
jgi:7,8-dihydroneopterin aldolase/epimerase/oxygenase